MAAGKRQLMDAALRLMAQQEAAHALSLRELAREAGLNHNTFYRHFDSLDALQQALVDEFTATLAAGMQAARERQTGPSSVTHRVVGWLFDHAAAHRELFVVAYRVMHGPPCAARSALEACLRSLQRDMLRAQRAMGLLPEGDDARWLQVLTVYGQVVFGLTVRYLEHPRQRRRLLDEAQSLLATLVAGTQALR